MFSEKSEEKLPNLKVWNALKGWQVRYLRVFKKFCCTLNQKDLKIIIKSRVARIILKKLLSPFVAYGN